MSEKLRKILFGSCLLLSMIGHFKVPVKIVAPIPPGRTTAELVSSEMALSPEAVHDNVGKLCKDFP